jgi:Transposase IS66 family
MTHRFVLPTIPEAERTPLVEALLGLIEGLAQRVQRQEEEIAHLKDEIRILKGQKGPPRFKPSKMEERTNQKTTDSDKADSRRPGSDKRGKNAELIIHEDKVIALGFAPAKGSRFKGYRDVVVQDLVLRAHNTRYRLARWQLPNGEFVTARLPAQLRGHRYGTCLRSYVLYQHHHCQVTQPLLLEQLREWGIDISSGGLDALLSADQGSFHAEKDALLEAGLASASSVTVDDTGARHRGQNGFVTTIGNPYFAWFKSTLSKSRINFLELLCAGNIAYRINGPALQYMRKQGLPRQVRRLLAAGRGTHDAPVWSDHLDRLSIRLERHRRIATEGALIGELAERGLSQRLAIVSDDAGQFDVLTHGLCWIHTERLVHTMLPLNEDHRQDIAKVRAQLWQLYADLKSYKQNPTGPTRDDLARRFDTVFAQRTCYQGLDALLRRLRQKKSELLLVLERPDIPLHTNDSERDIRDFVKRRKVSGGTRSELGRQCRDTFASLKKTCRKLGISFWDYLSDRLTHAGRILPLPFIVQFAARSA